jgi:para-nitrobenzyl esterase
MPYVFGTLNNPPAEDAALSDTVQGYWTRFAATADPNGEGALEWPAFDETTDQRMNLDISPAVVSGYRRAECDMWETIYAAQFQ